MRKGRAGRHCVCDGRMTLKVALVRAHCRPVTFQREIADLPQATHLWGTMDRKGNGQCDFPTVISVLYPGATKEEVKHMVHMASKRRRKGFCTRRVVPHACATRNRPYQHPSYCAHPPLCVETSSRLCKSRNTRRNATPSVAAVFTHVRSGTAEMRCLFALHRRCAHACTCTSFTCGVVLECQSLH